MLGVRERLAKIRRVVLVGSGKGGVGKSLVAVGIARRLSEMGRRTGILDLDLHGASVPNYLGVEPPLSSGPEGLEPAVSGRLKVMSVSLLTGEKPVPVKGQDKSDLIPQLFALTHWGTLDCLVVDLPPSLGEELSAALHIFSNKATLVLVTTPSFYSLSIVSRMRELAETEGVAVDGVVVNMAYMTQGGTRIHPFGRCDRKSIEKKLRTKVIAEIPLDERLSRGRLKVSRREKDDVSTAFEAVASKLLRNGRRVAGNRMKTAGG